VKVVILTTLRTGRVEGLEAAVARWVAAGDHVALITLHDQGLAPQNLVELVVLGAPSTGARLGVIGRALVRLYPGSLARQLHRKLQASKSAQTAIKSADILVAADTPAITTLWKNSRKRPDLPHISGLAAALQLSQG
jgi:hypothetical protein